MKSKQLIGCMGMLMTMVVMPACSNDNDESDNNDGGTETTGYVWSTDNGIKACSQILFDEQGRDNPNGNVIGNGDQEFVFKGKQTLKKGTYLLKGWIYIADGAQLTLEPGTIIKGDKGSKSSLIAERGGQLIAKGTATAPIVFTSGQPAGSRKPGDWGGIVLCGKARNNKEEMQIEGGPRSKHGGKDDADSSGILQYVRIEFAGYPFQKDKEINALTLGSVGTGTSIEHIQVSYTNDDAYEWFGGTVNAKYLVSYHGWDDDFDTDNGFSGNVQFGLVVHNSKIADTSLSNGFESDNNSGGDNTTPFTSPTFSNITFVGPKVDSEFTNTVDYIMAGNYNPNNGSAIGLYQSAMQIRRNARLNCVNSVALGYPIGFMLDNLKGDTQGAANAGNLKINNVYLAGMDITGSDANKLFEDVLVTGYDSKSKPITDATQPSFSTTWFLKQSGNKVLTNIADLGLEADNYMPTASSIVLDGADFTNFSSWFTKVSYIGAFTVGDKWLDGWTNFDPHHTKY